MSELIFDIGMNNGDDVAYYLHDGYRVVGVEANPQLAESCGRRFHEHIRKGSLSIVNAGILEQPGTFTFYQSLENDGWSSFDSSAKRDHPGDWNEISVPCITTANLIAEHGKPFFMKVDIEGADIQTLHSLTPKQAPKYVSLELNYRDPFLEKLIALGYDAFKFVNGETFRPNPEIFEHQIAWRALRKLGRKLPVVRSAIRMLPQSIRAKSEYDPPGKHSPNGYDFGTHCSGPFGEEAAGEWMTGDQAKRWLRKTMADYKRGGHSVFWWDVHARHSAT